MAKPKTGRGSRPSDSAIKSIRRSILASLRFGHNRPSAERLSSFYGVPVERVEQLINEYYGPRRNFVQRYDNKTSQAERSQLRSRGFGGLPFMFNFGITP